MSVQQSIDHLSDKVINMENKLDQLSDVIVVLARIEEKLSSQKDDVDGFGRRLSSFEERLAKVELVSGLNSHDGQRITRWLERIVYGLVILGLGTLNFFKSGS